MSPWGVTRLVAWREIIERGRSRAMLVSTAVSVAILVAVVLAAGAAGGDDTPSFDVGAVGLGAVDVVAVATDMAGDEAEIDVTEVADEADARRLVTDGDLDAVLVGDRIVVASEVDDQLAALLQAAHREVALADALTDAGASPEEVAAASPEPLAVAAADPEDDTSERQGLATVGTMLLYAQLIGFGYWVASGIVEEKSSRVVELLLAKTRARPLLAGKIIGLGTIGLAQLVIFVAVGLGLATATGSVDLPPGTAGVAVGLVLWFLAGYALYASVFAMGGALASRAEELQGTTGPITIVIMVAFFAALFGTDDPDGTMAQVTSFVPFTAPLVMPVRMAAGAVAPWEVAAAAALVAAAIVVVVQVAARVYSGGILFTRGQLKLREALARAEA